MRKIWLCLLLCALLLLPACAEKQAAGVEFTYYYHGYIVQAGRNFLQVPSNQRLIHSEEEYQRFLEYNPALKEITPFDTVDFSKENLWYYGKPRGFDANSDWSGRIEALIPRGPGGYFEIVWDETVAFGAANQTQSVGYQIYINGTNSNDNVCVREVFLLKVPKTEEYVAEFS